MQSLGLLGMCFDADCGGIFQDFFTFIQIGSGHAVDELSKRSKI